MFADCSDFEEQCKNMYKIKSFPAFLLLKPGGGPFDREKFDFDFDYNKMLYLLYNEYKTDIVEGSMDSALDFVRSTISENKLPVLYFYNGVILF